MTQDGPGDGGERAPVPSAATEAMPEGFLAPGQVLGDRYQIRSQLGRGGMGEVWRAFDLKLRVEVALKAMLPDLFKNEKRRDHLRREVRAAREVVSPNVCRIFDLIEVDGTELVSMEYVDGGTLLDLLAEGGPLDLKEAQDIASQFLAGLEAIHQAGLIHRDVKPENIMITRAGRVVLMDFGLARQEDSGAGTVSGTPAYMAPEQAAGLQVDARADVYSAGVVLAEMVSPDGIKDLESRQSVWEGIRHEPARVPDSPWAPVLKKAVAKEPDQRYNSAHTLTRALEDVTLRVEGAEDLTPYPGLASFTEEDAEYFFGREAEIEAAWRRLEGAHLLAIVGPSGAGKTSFIAAGLVPNAPGGWSIVRCTPGNAAIPSLARVMAREMAGDADAMELAIGFDDPDVAVELFSRWRHGHDQALLIVDQFEELFTQNPLDVQTRFAALLGRLALEANVRVLLWMRDDFLMQCKTHDALAPVFESLIPLMAPVGLALRRAFVQPAMKCGYRFEDDELVNEMLEEVEGERGALPLLAFAMSRLWDKRDRDNGLLTRQAYRDIGGVGGALARHAEATIDRIGADHVPLARELFRNLVTAEGTRAVRDWDELLSVFDESQRRPADETVRELIDARLLTSYEIHEEEQESTRRVEIIHESLLANWPRLVRWQTQDADAAQLRDQLRQAARTWDDQGRSDDTLWTGSVYREFALWRERYPGGLTEIEEDFSSAMTSLAKRRKRRRRMAVTAVLVIAAVVTAVMTVLWRRSVLQERRAEAQKLVALGQVRLEDDPTAALSYATQSLQLADSEESRLLALEALWEGPTAFIVNETPSIGSAFSPGGNWLVQTHEYTSSLAIISRDGNQRVLEHPSETGTTRTFANFSGSEDLFSSMEGIGVNPFFALWSASEGRLIASARQLRDADRWGSSVINEGTGRPRVILAQGKGDLGAVDTLLTDGSHVRLGEFRLKVSPGNRGNFCLDQAGNWLAVVESNDVSIIWIGENQLSERRLLGRHAGDLFGCVGDPLGRFLVTATRSGGVKRWDPSGERAPAEFRLPPGLQVLNLSKDGSYLLAAAFLGEDASKFSIWSLGESELELVRAFEDVTVGLLDFEPIGGRLVMTGPHPAHRLWSFSAPAGAAPIILRRGPSFYAHVPSFSPDGRWLATNGRNGSIMWPLVRPYPAVINVNFKPWTYGVAFGPDGRFLATSAGSEVRMWPLAGTVPPPGHVVFEGTNLSDVAVSPDGEMFAAGDYAGSNGVWMARDGGEPQQLTSAEGIEPGTGMVFFSPDGRLVAAATGFYDPASLVFHIWEVESREEVAVLRSEGMQFRYGPGFASDGRFLTGTTEGVVAWDVETGNHEVLVEISVQMAVASEDGRRLLVTEEGEGGGMQDPAGSPSFYDLETGDVTVLTSHGLHVREMTINEEGTVAVTGDTEGTIRVGPVTGEEPHVLFGHDGEILDLAVDPVGRWIASAGMDETLRLWPMPDLSKPPLHTLPREELIAKLKTLTNLRVVRDDESPTGWKLTHDPFPGWETVPTW